MLLIDHYIYYLHDYDGIHDSNDKNRVYLESADNRVYDEGLALPVVVASSNPPIAASGKLPHPSSQLILVGCELFMPEINIHFVRLRHVAMDFAAVIPPKYGRDFSAPSSLLFRKRSRLRSQRKNICSSLARFFLLRLPTNFSRVRVYGAFCEKQAVQIWQITPAASCCVQYRNLLR